MATRTPNIQTPGASPAPSPSPAPAPKGSDANPLTDADAAADLAGLPRPIDPPADETLEQKVARLEAENERLKAGQVVVESLPADAIETDDDAAYRNRARGLRAHEVDASRLKRAVLTLDGWVCPEKAPAPVGRE